jgi:photosystem II stability/assembly factor-like uncharacterized protein
MYLKPLATRSRSFQPNNSQEPNRKIVRLQFLVSFVVPTLFVVSASSSYLASAAQSQDSLSASSRTASASTRRHSSPKRSRESFEGLNLAFVTPDRDGGVWLSGDAYGLSGLLVNDGSELQMVTVNGITTVRAPQFVTRAIGWMTDNEFAYRTMNAGRTWTRIDSGDLSGVRTLYFTDDQNGWIGGVHGNVFRTIDGGQTWHKRFVGFDYEIRQLIFVDKLNGWALGNGGSAGRALSALLRTKDGGETWRMLSNVHVRSPQSIESMVFVNSKKGWGIDGEQSNIVHTADGGQTWTIQRRASRGWQSLSFINSQEGWAAGPDGIIHTSDGGQAWEYQIEPESTLARGLRQITFIDRKQGWVVSRDGALRTTDGGDTWKPISDEWKLMVPSQATLLSHSVNGSPPSAAQTVRLCDLIARPEFYRNKVVRVDTMAVATFELSFMYDADCAWPKPGVDLGFDSEETSLKVTPLLDFSRGRNAERRAYVMLVGRFEGPRRGGYGHLGGFEFRFTASEVLKVEPVPDSVPSSWPGPKRKRPN